MLQSMTMPSSASPSDPDDFQGTRPTDPGPNLDGQVDASHFSAQPPAEPHPAAQLPQIQDQAPQEAPEPLDLLSFGDLEANRTVLNLSILLVLLGLGMGVILQTAWIALPAAGLALLLAGVILWPVVTAARQAKLPAQYQQGTARRGAGGGGYGHADLLQWPHPGFCGRQIGKLTGKLLGPWPKPLGPWAKFWWRF